jgi:hypothetical protein
MVTLDTLMTLLWGACIAPVLDFGRCAWMLYTARAYRVTKQRWPHPRRIWWTGTIIWWTLIGSLLLMSGVTAATNVQIEAFAGFSVSTRDHILVVGCVVLFGASVALLAWYYALYMPSAQRFGHPEELLRLARARQQVEPLSTGGPPHEFIG